MIRNQTGELAKNMEKVCSKAVQNLWLKPPINSMLIFYMFIYEYFLESNWFLSPQSFEQALICTLFPI